VLGVVLATDPGYPASVRVGPGTESPVRVRNHQGIRPALSWRGCYPDRTENRGFLAGLEPDCGSKYTVPTPLAPIKFSSSDHMVTWSVCRLCSFMRSFTSRCQICDPTNIRRIAVKEDQILSEIRGFSIATQRILVVSQI
jgi:hypothetical protein